MKKILFTLVIALLTFSLLGAFAACSKSSDNEAGSPYFYSESGMEDATLSNISAANRKSASAGNGSARVILTADRLMVYTVDTALTVHDYAESAAKIRTALAAAEGYEESSYTSSGGVYRFTLRVPTVKLNDFLDAIAESGTVEEQTLTGEDITDRYIDAQNERDALLQKKAAFEALAAQAATFDEQLKIQEKILDVAREIDYYNDKISDYKKAGDYSTVHITLYEEGTYEEPTFWDHLGEVFFGSGRSIGSVFGGILIAIVAVLPYAALLAALFGVYVLIKFIVCRIRKKPFTLFASCRARRAARKARKEKALANLLQDAQNEASAQDKGAEK